MELLLKKYVFEISCLSYCNFKYHNVHASLRCKIEVSITLEWRSLLRPKRIVTDTGGMEPTTVLYIYWTITSSNS